MTVPIPYTSFSGLLTFQSHAKTANKGTFHLSKMQATQMLECGGRMLGCMKGKIGLRLSYGRGSFRAIAGGVVTEEELEVEGLKVKGSSGW